MKNVGFYPLQFLMAFSITLMLSACGGSSTVPLKKTSTTLSSTTPSTSSAISSLSAVGSISPASLATNQSVTSSSAILSSAPTASVASSAIASTSSSAFAASSELITRPEIIVSSSLQTSSFAEASSAEQSLSSEEFSSSEEPSSAIASSSKSSSSSEGSSNPSAVQSSSSAPTTTYHVRGSHNDWADGWLMTQVGTSNSYQSCINFTSTSSNAFKIDPNGGWGGDDVMAQDYVVDKGWVKILFNSADETVKVEQNLGINCTVAGGTAYYLRGTQTDTAWSENLADVFSPVAGSTTHYEICRNFIFGDLGGDPRFKIDPNGGWGGDEFPADNVPTNGWTKIIINGSTRTILSTESGLNADCSNSK